MSHPPVGRPAALDALDFDPETLLDREIRVLLDPRRLSSLHVELEDELGGERAALALLQMGFLHGLQDAQHALAREKYMRHEAGTPLRPPLRMVYHTSPTLDGLEVRGAWPDRHEASARLSALGATDTAVCHMSAGYTSGWLSGVLEHDLLAIETHCGATGEECCRFVARPPEAWRSRGDARARALLEAVPIAEFRALVESRGRHDKVGFGISGIDRGAAAVHIWGPVMVMPFSSPDEAVQAVELIGCDPSAAQVSVVVVDLDGAIVDEAFGALALEQIVHAIDSWGAEAIFSMPSPFYAAVVADLANPPLLVVKNLDEAVARAFLIANSQRQLV